MKQLKRLTALPLFLLMLTITAHAGIIDAPAPPPAATTATAPSDIWLPSDAEGPSVASPAGTDLALSLLQELLLVF